jgi:hypothetical protein
MYGVIWYSEKQRFKQWWLWLIMIGINALFLFAFIKQVIWSKPVGNQPMGNIGLMGMLLFVCALTVLFFYTRLETQLTEEGVVYRFFPFRRKFTIIPWDEIAEASVLEYSPIIDFGGWGVRYSLTGKGKAFNVAGNKGLQLVLKNNDRILIGTQNPETIREVLSARKSDFNHH